MRAAFPTVMTVVCSRHVKDNADRKLDTFMGNRTQLRRQIHASLFGDGGLASCNDLITYDDAVNRIHQSQLAAVPPAFVDYFEQVIVHLQRENVAANQTGWTNNNCENYNHILMQSVQWEPQQLLDLIDKLCQLVIAQYMEADRTLCG